MKSAEPHPSLVLDFLMIAVGLLLTASLFGLQVGQPATKGAGATVGGIFIIYIGLLFSLSHFFPRRSFVFSFLDYICRERSRPAGRAMAWVYFAVIVFFGCALMLVGLGVR